MTAEITTAAMYLPTELPDTIIEIFLIIGKSGMAPLKSQILPKLELLRAPLLAKLLAFVTDTYSSLISINQVFAYTDSEVVLALLAWISISSHRWKTSVTNRVCHIQETIPNVP